MRALIAFIATAFAMAYSFPATAGTLLVSGGVTRGVTGLNVGGTFYDVAFLDGTCISVYSGCDSNSDFVQVGSQGASAVANVLNQNAGAFTSVLGCTEFPCKIAITTSLVGDLTYGPLVYGGPTSWITTDFQSWPSEDFSNSGSFTYARFSLGVAPSVPEPATWAMMLIGFGAVGYRMRRKRRVALQIA